MKDSSSNNIPADKLKTGQRHITHRFYNRKPVKINNFSMDFKRNNLMRNKTPLYNTIDIEKNKDNANHNNLNSEKFNTSHNKDFYNDYYEFQTFQQSGNETLNNYFNKNKVKQFEITSRSIGKDQKVINKLNSIKNDEDNIYPSN